MRHFRGEAFFIIIFLIFVFMAPGTASAFDISGSDEINPGGNAQYTVEGIEGDVTWSASDNFGSGGGISQDGELTLGSNACGVVKVTAYANATAVTKQVRVSGTSGTWSLISECHNSTPGWCMPGTSEKDIMDGKYKYRVFWVPSTTVRPGDCAEICEFDCSSSCNTYGQVPNADIVCACGGGSYAVNHEYRFGQWNRDKFVPENRIYEWVCDTLDCNNPNNLIDNDGDSYYAMNSCGNDCNDDDYFVNPGVVEVCGDGKDNNCDGEIDEMCDKPSPPAEPVLGCPVRQGI